MGWQAGGSIVSLFIFPEVGPWPQNQLQTILGKQRLKLEVLKRL
jgi:hypothetical protein